MERWNVTYMLNAPIILPSDIIATAQNSGRLQLSIEKHKTSTAPKLDGYFLDKTILGHSQLASSAKVVFFYLAFKSYPIT